MATNHGSDKLNPMRLYGAGFVFIATFMLMLWLGYWADMKMNSLPRLMILFGVIGFLVGLRRLVKDARQFAGKKLSGDDEEADKTCEPKQ